MTSSALLVEDWRGDFVENSHHGHAVICDEKGEIVQAWGNPDQIILPRSSCKMIQALPLLECGAADDRGLTSEHLALACASHIGADMHTTRVANWLADLNLSEKDLRCGPQIPIDRETREDLIRNNDQPCQLHNACSGKHAGFLTLTQHLKAGSDYNDLDHPLQKAIRSTFEEVTGQESPGYGIDGCSAPNFATTVHGLARAMAGFAAASDGGNRRDRASVRLREAMIAHPEMVRGEYGADAELAHAADGRAAIKHGADGVYTVILPEQKMGVALKISDGNKEASECAIAAILVRLDVIHIDHPAIQRRLNAPILSRLGLHAGNIRPAPGLLT